MANTPQKEVTIDRISNSGNPIAAETHNGKAIHVPGRRPGDRLLVKLQDVGGYYKAKVVDRYETGVRPQTKSPSGPSGSSTDGNLRELAERLCDEPLSVQQRHSDSNLSPAEYPGKSKRKEIATRHD